MMFLARATTTAALACHSHSRCLVVVSSSRAVARLSARLVPLRAHGSHHHHGPLIDRSSAQGTRVTLAGLGVNVGLTVVKGAGGLAWNSAALVAEAAHSLSDLTSDLVTLFAYRVARTPATTAFPDGLAKLEPFGGVVVSGLLVAAGASIALTSIDSLYVLATSTLPPPAPLPSAALYIMVASIALKEALYQWTRRVAHSLGSSVLLANAWHHRLDAASSVVALAAVAGAVNGWTWLDPVGGVLVAGMVVRAGWKAGRPAMMELLDGAAPVEVSDTVSAALTAAIAARAESDVIAFEHMRVRKAGPFVSVEFSLRLSSPQTTSAARAGQISEEVERALAASLPNLRGVSIRIAAAPTAPAPPTPPTH